MRKAIYCILTLMAIILTGGCDKDLDFEGFKSKPSLVVQGFISTDSTVKIRLTQTLDIMSTEEDGIAVTDASVELLDNSGNKFILAHSTNGYYSSNDFPSDGRTYKLFIRKSGFDDVEAVDSIPKTRPVTDTASAFGPLDRFEITLKLKDPLTERNYYLLEILEKSKHYIPRPKTPAIIDTIEGYFPVKFGSSNNIFISGSNIQEWIYDFEMFDDGFFNGTNYQLNLTIDQILLATGLNKSKSEGVVVVIKTISKNYYDYYLSVIRNSRNYGGPFSTNFNPTSNVKGGYGIFAGYQQSADTFNFQ